MIDPGTASVIAAGIGVGSQMMQNSASILDGGHSARKQARYQQQLNQQMAEWNLENVTKPVYDLEQQQWETRFNMENAYNDPSAQIQRMRNAGINPAGINFDTGVPAASPSTNEAASQMAAPADYGQMEALQNARQTNLNQAVNTLSQAVLNKYSGQNQDAQAEKAREEAKELRMFRKGRLELQDIAIDTANLNKDAIKANTDLVKEKINECKAAAAELKQKVKVYEQQIEESKQKVVNLKGEKEYQDEVTKAYKEMWPMQKRLLISQYHMNEAQAELCLKNAYNAMMTGKMLSMDVNLRELGWGQEQTNYISRVALEGDKIVVEGTKNTLDYQQTEYWLEHWEPQQNAREQMLFFDAEHQMGNMWWNRILHGAEVSERGFDVYNGYRMGNKIGGLKGTAGSMMK